MPCVPRNSRQLVGLAREVGLRVGGDLPLLLVHRLVGAAGEARQLAAAGVAQHVHEEEAVLGGRVAEPEHRAVAGLAVDVGDAEALVAHDRHVGARRVDALGVVRLDAERRVLEVVRDLARLQARASRTQVAVHAELVAAVGDGRAGGEEAASCDRVVAAVGARRQDVAEAAAVEGAVGLDGGVRAREAAGERRQRRRAGDRRQARQLGVRARRHDEHGDDGGDGDAGDPGHAAPPQNPGSRGGAPRDRQWAGS